jgi:hypothetical protein
MLLFAAVASIVFAVVGRDNTSPQVRYGVKVFLEFVIIGLGLSWIIYFIP